MNPWVAMLLISCRRDRPSTLELVEGGVVTCADAAARQQGPFEHRQTPRTQPLEGYNLVGGGIAIEDYDGDGKLDLFLPGDRTAEFWWGTGDGFDEQGSAALAGLNPSALRGVGAVNVDIDADGDKDLLVTRWQLPPRLLRNNGDRTFSDITLGSGLESHQTRAQSASWADIDGDEDLDLFIGAYGEGAKLDVREPVPDCSDHLPDRAGLWLNDGDGTFTDISDRLPQAVHDGYAFMSAFYDVNGDQLPELFTAHDDGQCAGSLLLSNEGDGNFAVDAGSGYHPDKHDMGMAVGDLNGDELPDFALTSWTALYLVESQESPLGDNGAIWIDSADARLLSLTADQVYGWGAEFGDLDNDADLDLAVTFGYWQYYDKDDEPHEQSDALWLQGADGVLHEQASAWGVDETGYSRSVVLADLNGDGWLDMAKRVLNSGTPMHLSRCGVESWLIVRLQDEGANRDAIGARIRAIANGKKQVRWMQSGSSGMYSGSPLSVHFGLGSAESVDLEIVWPDGEELRMEDVTARQQVTIRRIRAK